MPGKPLTSAQREGQALLTGTVMGMLMKHQASHDAGINLLDVRPVIDDDGNYEPFIDVTLPSGGQYRLAVVHQTTISEEP